MMIDIHDDFDPCKICLSGQCFRATPLSDGSFRFIAGDRALSLFPRSDAIFEADCPDSDWESLWRSYFDFDRDYTAIRRDVFSDDDFLTNAASFGQGIRILRQEPWETLISFIISQRKSIPAIKTSIERLCRLCGKAFEHRGETLYAFPSPSAVLELSDAQLQSCGLGYRAPYVRNAAAMVCGGGVSLASLYSLNDEELLLALKGFSGVGDKVASCVSLFAYSRLDCAPVDVWISRVIQNRYGGLNPFPRYLHNSGVYQQYMFYYAQQTKLPD